MNSGTTGTREAETGGQAVGAQAVGVPPVAGALPARLLSVAVVLTCAGMTAATLRGDGTSINAFLFLSLGLTHEDAASIERIAAGAVMLASACALLWPRWALLLPVAAYLLAESVAGWHLGGYPFSEWTPAARAPAYLAPVALAILATVPTQPARIAGLWRAIASWTLRLAMAAVFVAHGLEALQAHPRFIDLILSSSLNLTGIRLTESLATTALQVIGVVDICVAVALLIKPWRAVLAWIAFWAALVAMSRMTAHGWGAYPEFLLRSTYILIPLALWAIHRPQMAAAAPARSNGESR
ncbi:hypothetical protein BH23VER1_BH23VER1_26050 [soil metagenome]